MLIILILLLVIGYAARALDGDSRTGSQPAGRQGTSSAPAGAGHGQSLPQPAQDGGRLAAKAAIPSCACGLAK